MSTRLVGWALRDAPATYGHLSTGARLLLVYLADHFNEDEGAAWPSQARLAKLMGCSERSCRNWLVELQEAGIVATETRAGTSSLYKLTPAEFAWVPRHQVPTPPATRAGHPGTTCLQSSKEPIKEPKADPAFVADAIATMRQVLRGGPTPCP